LFHPVSSIQHLKPLASYWVTKTLAQTWQARTGFYRSILLNIKAAIALTMTARSPSPADGSDFLGLIYLTILAIFLSESEIQFKII
jgi:hypothetical protein